jgi:hypothetical protein
MALVLFDERLGQIHTIGRFSLEKTRLSVRDLIRLRVELELERETERRALAGTDRCEFRNPTEALLNAVGAGSGSWIIPPGIPEQRNLDQLIDEAERAFVAGRNYILLGNCQAEELDQKIDLEGTAEATFLLLTPLQGG